MNKSDVHGRYVISPAQILERFLIMGSMGPTYVANDKFASFPVDTLKSVKAIVEGFSEDARKVLSEVVTQNKAPRKPPVLLAIAAALNNVSTRKWAEPLAGQLVSTGTDQFVLAKFMLDFGRGKGKSFKRHANILYSKLDNESGRDRLALNLVKYRNRAGWTHRDLLRVGHFNASKKNNDLFAWVVGKGPACHPLIEGFELAKEVKTYEDAIHLLEMYPGLPWEALPTEVLSGASVWEALLPRLGNTAIIRNLGRMECAGVDLSGIRDRLVSACASNHPVSALSALKVYTQGHGEKGSLYWKPRREVIEALDAGFYASFGSLRKSEAKVFFGMDVSGSMRLQSSTVAGLTCCEVSAAMAMAAMKQQPYMIYGFSKGIIPLEIRDDWGLHEVIRYVSTLPFSSTDCSLPMRFCTDNRIRDVDLFAVYTDNDTNQRTPPSRALAQYRKEFNPNAKLATVACMGNAFSIADPTDPGMVDFVGFDPSVPEVMLSLAEQPLV